MADELEPCPFCGGEGKYHGSYFEDDVCEYVSCTRCNASTPLMYKKGESIKWWNRRPSPWHTGTPTEGGMFLVYLEDGTYDIYEFGKEYEAWHIGFKGVVKWQKIDKDKED